MLCKSAGQRFPENDHSMKWPAQSFLNVDAISVSRGGSQVARSIGEVPSRSKSAWYLHSSKNLFQTYTTIKSIIQIKSNQWISRNCPRDQAYIKPMVTLSLGGSYLRISIAYKSRTAPQGATTDHTFDAITAWRLSWRNGTDCKAVVVNFFFSSWLPMPPAADWIASSKQASASYVGKLKKGQGQPETVGKLANGSRPSYQRLREKKNYLVSFSFLAGPRWTCNLWSQNQDPSTAGSRHLSSVRPNLKGSRNAANQDTSTVLQLEA